MVVGTLSLVQKGQTSGRSTLWMQYTVCSGIVVNGGGDIALVQQGQTSGCSAQWTQYAVHAVE